MRNKLAVFLLAAAAPLGAQESPLPYSSVKINLPPDSPVTLISADLGESRATVRGSATVLDLHMNLSLRNASAQRISGVTLLVLAQEVTPGGRGSVTRPSLSVGPGESFPMRIDLRLMRPSQFSSSPLVQVNLDGILFQNLGFYGPNRLDSKRTLTALEMEAQRDRQHFKAVLAQQGPAGLQREALDSLTRQAERPRVDVRVSRGGHSVSSAALGPEHVAQFAFLEFPDSPIQPLEGWAQIAGNEARAPRVEVRNRSRKPVRYVEIGWIVTDNRGKQYMAASLPASDTDLFLPPGQKGRVLQDTSLRFTRNEGEPVNVAKMTGFVSQVEYTDGRVWVPNRQTLENARLLGILAASPEEQRLTDMYRKKGLKALVEELEKF